MITIQEYSTNGDLTVFTSSRVYIYTHVNTHNFSMIKKLISKRAFGKAWALLKRHTTTQQAPGGPGRRG